MNSETGRRTPPGFTEEPRTRLLDAALALCIGAREDVTLSAVAQRAGVGISTLYRHFPTRDALVEASIAMRLSAADGAPKLLKKMSPAAGLEEWLARYCGLIVASAVCRMGSRRSLHLVRRPSAYPREPLANAAALSLGVAAKSGAVRGDVDLQNVLLALAASAWSFAGDKDWKDRAERVRRLVIDGLRYQPNR